MKLHSLALALAACLSSAAAQGMAGLPSCAQECATGAIPKECSLIDVECICKTKSFVADMACCVSKSCEAGDQDAALDFANGICGGAGVSDLPQTATCASDSTTTTTASEPSETAATTTSTDSATGTETSAETPTETSSETSSESPSETPTDPETTDSAAVLRGKELGLLAGIAAGAAFLM
ncbi:CFEM domain-containing protein [Aspergillus lucknowensis]|uniref:CFEM domain-containing protein n=1 Tax=Aspergillus lucknowensis TaxID=176173 RepID=A0ABR4LJ80_9EURO